MKRVSWVGSAAGISALALALGLLAVTSSAAPPSLRLERAPLVGATLEGEQYLIAVETPALQVGKEGALRVSIEGRAGFKFNKDFPLKLEGSEPPAGIDAPKRLLKRADGALDEAGKVFTLKVPITAKRAGDYQLEATIKFSVCSEAKCVVQRQTLRAKVAAQ